VNHEWLKDEYDPEEFVERLAFRAR